MNKDRILKDLEEHGLPLKITDKICLYDVCQTETGVLFDFSFYDSYARVQYDIDENGNFDFVFAEIYDGCLSDSFEDFYDENEDLLKEIFESIKDEI
jgi:hypothetical protein